MFVIRKTPALIRMFSSDIQTIKDRIKIKHKGDEDVLEKKNNKRLLKKLVDKIDKLEVELSDPAITKKSRDSLAIILNKHKLKSSEALIDDLITWKKIGF